MSGRKRTASYRLWGSTEDGSIEFVSLTSETLEGTLKLLREDFYRNEHVAICTELSSNPAAMDEVDQFLLEAIKDGVSIIAIEVDTGKIVGAVINKILVAPKPGSSEKSEFQRFVDEEIKTKNGKSFMQLIVDLDEKVDYFKRYNVQCSFELMFLSVDANYRRRRIGELLISSSMELARQLKQGKPVKTPVNVGKGDSDNPAGSIETPKPQLISVLFSSNYSTKIGLKLGLDKLDEVKFEDLEYDGKTYREILGDEHSGIVAMAKII